jgi:hypothetical protein
MACSRVVVGIALGFALVQVACAPSKASSGSDAGAKGSSSGGKSSGGGSSGGGSGSSGGSSGGAGSSGGSHDGGGTDGGTPPAAKTFTANMAGRFGSDLVLTMSGTATAADAYGLHIALEDSAGSPVNAFDAAWDGVPVVAERSVLFDSSVEGEKAFTGKVTLSGMLQAFPNIATVVASVESASGGTSASLTANVAAQAVKNLGDSCDESLLTNRCAPGLSCSGTPAACMTGTAPQIAKLSYVSDTFGPHMLFLGSDPADDISTFHVEFLDTTDAPVLVDMSGNGDFFNSFDINAQGSSTAGGFFFDNQAAQGFDTTVPRIAATPTDAEGRSGPRIVGNIATPTLAGAGSACDPRGFTACVTKSVCVPSATVGKGTCISIASEMDVVAKAALTVEPGATSFAPGYANGPSLWQPPAGCVGVGIVNRPQGIVHLKVPSAMSALTITTANSETNFDTFLFVLPGTGSTAGAALGCNDDTQGYTSTVELSSVAAGDYTIVVGSTGRTGGNFGVSVSAQ